MLKKLPVLDIEGPPLADPGQWTLKVDGLVERPAVFGIREVREMNPVDTTQPIICVEGWDMWVRWTGVRLGDVIRRVGPKPEAGWLTFYSYSEYTDSLSMGDAHILRRVRGVGLLGSPGLSARGGHSGRQEGRIWALAMP